MKAGIKYPNVLPEPVFAIATISLLCRAIGHVWAWIGVGDGNPAESNSLRISGGRPLDSNVMYGAGMFSPCATND
jgi:hypothetical protein